MQICVSVFPAPGAAELGESLGLDGGVREDACLPPAQRGAGDKAQWEIFAKPVDCPGFHPQTTVSTAKPLRQRKTNAEVPN